MRNFLTCVILELMKLPQVLVHGKFTTKDLIVSLTESTRKIDPIVEGKIDIIWEKMQEEAKLQGKLCYNGLSYRLNTLEQQDGKIILCFGILEYKVRDGLIKIPEYFALSEEYYRKGCFTCGSVKTSDNKYILVELSGKSMNQNKIELLGGIMETTIPMESGHDIFISFLNELEEEAGITEDDSAELYLRDIYLTDNTNIGFYFESVLTVSSDDLLKRFKNNKDADIKSLAFFTREEYIDVLKNHTSVNKNLTATLLEI